MLTAVIIPFRDRGTDPLRKRNLHTVLRHWQAHETNWAAIIVADDGRTGAAQFNRSAAYNRGAATMSTADVFVFAESDMLIDRHQIIQAADLATQAAGLVVPYTEYRYLSEQDSQLVCDGANPHAMTPESVIPDKHRFWPRTGPINVVSKQTLNLVGGFDEHFEGNWWDDRAMLHAFEVCAGPTRFVEGPAHHLYHLPGWTGKHLTREDKAATARNQHRYHQYLTASTPQQIHALNSPHERLTTDGRHLQSSSAGCQRNARSNGEGRS